MKKFSNLRLCIRNEAGTSLRFDLSGCELADKSFVSCLQLEQKIHQDEKKVDQVEKEAETEKKARRMIWKRYTQTLTLLKDCYSLFRHGKFSAHLSFTHKQHDHTIVFVVTGFNLSALPEEPAYYNTHQSFVGPDGNFPRIPTLLRKLDIPKKPETSNFFQIGVINRSVMFTSSIIQKAFLGISGYDYFQLVLKEHVIKWEARIPGPEYISRYCPRLLPSREEQTLTSHSSAAPILSPVSQSSLPVSTTTSPARNPAAFRSEPSSPPCLPSRAITTPVTDSIEGHLSGLTFPESSLPTNSDPESPRMVESTLVTKESQRDTANATGRQALADAEVRPPQIDDSQPQLSYIQPTINYGIARILHSQDPISSICIKDFTAMCLHARQAGRQTKVSTLWKSMPTNFSDTRFHLYFKNVKIQGIQMESFETEADTDACKDKVCVYGCKSLAGTKYTSRYVHVLMLVVR